MTRPPRPLLIGGLILVVAGAGYGKTGLLAQFAKTEGFTFSWLTLDEGEQDLRSFGEALVWSQRLIGRAAVGSYQALTNALVTYGGQLVPLLWNRLQRLMEEVGKEHWRIGFSLERR